MFGKCEKIEFGSCMYEALDDNSNICSECIWNFKNMFLKIKDNYTERVDLYKYNVIYLSGKVGSGKDTVADYLYDKYFFKGYRYGDELKEVLRSNGWDGKKDLKGRKLLQQIGLAFRNYDEDYWIKRLIEKNCDFESYFLSREYRNLCLIDCRHKNEIEKFPSLLNEYCNNSYKPTKQLTIQVVGPNHTNRDMDEETLNDISETSLDNYNFNVILCNDSTIDNLYKKVDNIIEKEFPYIFNPLRDLNNNI